MMWGQPKLGPSPIFGGDMFDPTGPLAPAMAPPVAPLAAAIAQKPVHHGASVWGILADVLSGAAGQPGQYAASLRQRQLQEMQMRQREAERASNREDARSNFTFEQDYRQAHPAPPQPDEFTRSMVAAGIDPASPQAQTLYRQRVTNLANPLVGVDVQTEPGGPMVRQFIRPGAVPPQPPAPGEVRQGHRFRGGNPADPNSWEPIGGASPSNGSGGFPGRH